MIEVVKIGVTSDEFKAHMADELSWTRYEGGSIPQGHIEVRFHDGFIDSHTDTHGWDWSEIEAWRLK